MAKGSNTIRASRQIRTPAACFSARVNIGSITSAMRACTLTVIDSTHASHSIVIFGGSGSLFLCISSVTTR